jgi:hypothetical protein
MRPCCPSTSNSTRLILGTRQASRHAPTSSSRVHDSSGPDHKRTRKLGEKKKSMGGWVYHSIPHAGHSRTSQPSGKRTARTACSCNNSRETAADCGKSCIVQCPAASSTRRTSQSAKTMIKPRLLALRNEYPANDAPFLRSGTAGFDRHAFLCSLLARLERERDLHFTGLKPSSSHSKLAWCFLAG